MESLLTREAHEEFHVSTHTAQSHDELLTGE
jgi:hypothetical protein